MDADTEAYVLLLLSDSNLPTGSFVASSGLESYLKHGFLDSTFNFVRDSLGTYAQSALPFVSDAHRVVERFFITDASNEVSEGPLLLIKELDELYDTMTLNHVAKRASKAQGVALLILYSKGFSRPPELTSFDPDHVKRREKTLVSLISQFKSAIRIGDSHGHLPICWGILTAVLGLGIARAQFLHLFLHARGLLSASVRLNILGPYGAQQLLLHAVQPLIQFEAKRTAHLRTGVLDTDETFDEMMDGPTTTWPLGEILAARHDLQHSRIFNS